MGRAHLLGALEARARSSNRVEIVRALENVRPPKRRPHRPAAGHPPACHKSSACPEPPVVVAKWRRLKSASIHLEWRHVCLHFLLLAPLFHHCRLACHYCRPATGGALSSSPGSRLRVFHRARASTAAAVGRRHPGHLAAAR